MLLSFCSLFRHCCSLHVSSVEYVQWVECLLIGEHECTLTIILPTVVFDLIFFDLLLSCYLCLVWKKSLFLECGDSLGLGNLLVLNLRDLMYFFLDVKVSSVQTTLLLKCELGLHYSCRIIRV